MRSHMFNHTGENGFSCDQCDMSFNRKSRLEQHIKLTHRSKDHVCNVCKLSFPSVQKLKRHEKTHEEAKTTKKSKRSATALRYGFFNAVCFDTFQPHSYVRFATIHSHRSKQFSCICVHTKRNGQSNAIYAARNSFDSIVWNGI